MNIEINDLLVNDICNRVCNMFEKQTMQNNICQSDAKRQENESKKQESVINAIGAIVGTIVEYFKEDREGQIKALKDQLAKAEETIRNTFTILTDTSFSSSNPEFNDRLSKLRKINNLVEEESKVESESENEVEPTSKKKK